MIFYGGYNGSYKKKVKILKIKYYELTTNCSCNNSDNFSPKEK